MPIIIEPGLSHAERIINQYGKEGLKKHLEKDDNWRLTKDWNLIGRKEQFPPDNDLWRYWVCLSGRGWGKTRTIVEWAKHQIINNDKKLIAAVAATLGDARSILVEGVSGILTVMDDLGPKHNKNTGEISFAHTDAKIFLHSAETPKRLRGPGFDCAICDEMGSWKYPFRTWSNLIFCTRIGTWNIAIATTPRPIPLLKEIISYDNTALSTGSTYANEANLPQEYIDEITKIYGDTRLGRQEIFAHMLSENPDALFNSTNIDTNRVKKAPDLKRIVVSVDPSGNKGKEEKLRKKEDGVGNDCGIVACGDDYDGHNYVLDDLTASAKPEEWAKKACDLCVSLEANLIVAEKNFGGEMVRAVLKHANPNIKVKLVHASRGKAIRAEPISMLYEQNKVSHVGIFPKLEDEMTQWDPSQKYSPNRLDALVWGLTWLTKGSNSSGRVFAR